VSGRLFSAGTAERRAGPGTAGARRATRARGGSRRAGLGNAGPGNPIVTIPAQPAERLSDAGVHHRPESCGSSCLNEAAPTGEHVID
jgi:hypothetical protein